MKILSWILSFIVPREAGTDEAAAKIAADAAAAAAAAGRETNERPEWCPEKFFDTESGIRTEIMAKSFVELEGKMREGKKALAQEILDDRAKEVPEKYSINLPEEITKRDDMEITLKDDDPLIQWFFGFSKELGLTQKQVDEAIGKYVTIELAAMPNMADEIKSLGDYGQDRITKVKSWLEKTLKDDDLKAISPMLTSAASVVALEKLMTQSGPGKFEGDGSGPALTLEELRTMQNDPKYFQEKDPAFIKRVEEGYRVLYGTGKVDASGT